jgi:hypothetical protein
MHHSSDPAIRLWPTQQRHPRTSIHILWRVNDEKSQFTEIYENQGGQKQILKNHLLEEITIRIQIAQSYPEGCRSNRFPSCICGCHADSSKNIIQCTDNTWISHMNMLWFWSTQELISKSP